MRALLSLIVLTLELSAYAESSWVIESEAKEAKVSWSKDSVCDIRAPKGLTLWNKTLLRGNVCIDYEARIMSDGRVSDLNCFWMADKALSEAKKRGGVFEKASSMSLYYFGYGGNGNTTSRFRRYDGQPHPAIIREYKDQGHLIKPDHWYRIHLESRNGRALYVIDGDTLVNYVDLHPLTQGYFGFRTTQSHAQMRRFRITQQEPSAKKAGTSKKAGVRSFSLAEMNCIGEARPGMPFTFGIPFAAGEMKKGERITLLEAETDQWPLAYWPDGSIKWLAVSGCLPGNVATATQETVVPSVVLNGRRQEIRSVRTEREGKFSKCVRYDGQNFTMRIYSWKGCPEEKVVFTSFIDEQTAREGLHELSLQVKVPLQDRMHERHVWFAQENGIRDMAVKPLIARRVITLDSVGNPANEKSRTIMEELASWDGFRLSQLSPNGYSIRKRATEASPWIGTIEGRRAPGLVAVSDKHRSVSVQLEDFWQSYPSTLQVEGARSDTAVISVALWSPEAESMNFAHYDTIPHGLEAAYEDIQPGMSTPVGTARTSTLWITALSESKPFMKTGHASYTPKPEYLHSKRAFGLWSLEKGSAYDKELESLMRFYERQQEEHGWYGYFNYGDFMHTYDESRGEWRYDVGGYAWDNTELGTPAMLWYKYLRSGDKEVWRLATRMTRHCSEVDTYHRGAHAGLGTRHNVLHWGCGAKEARISQAFWNRFMYYLTADERLGEIIREVRDADTLLYTLDPLRLAQPRSDRYPCTAPARLRIGPDWLAYAGNWFTEWERTGNTHYRDKILTGMKSISDMPHGLFSGPLALGYDPATGILSWEGDTAVQHTNHLCTIMGGFEFMNEMMLSIDNKAWEQVWLDHAANYRRKAKEITHNSFPCPRLGLYAFWQTGNREKLSVAKEEMRRHHPFGTLGYLFHTNNAAAPGQGFFFTNDAATWALDAIFLQEVE